MADKVVTAHELVILSDGDAQIEFGIEDIVQLKKPATSVQFQTPHDSKDPAVYDPGEG